MCFCKHHVGSLSNGPIFLFAFIRDSIKNGIFHKYTDCSANEWGEEVDVDVVTGAMETSIGKKNQRKENNQTDFEVVVENYSFHCLIL